MTPGALYHHWYPSYNQQFDPRYQTSQLNHSRYSQASGTETTRHSTSPYTFQSATPHLPYWNPSKMAGSNPGEMEDFQRLSDQYQPELPGPLVGDKLPMNVLVEEYTTADPTYIAKTLALAATYSGYRRIKGDGQCGWRGAVFGYFETLLQIGNPQLVMQEEIRLRSFADTMRMAGIDYDIIVDMFDFTWELFIELKKAVESRNNNEAVLLEWLNDEIKSNSIVYHFKMMTSAFLQLNPDNYEPFLEMPIHDYRVARIDPANQEIDQVGLQILTDGVIAQAGFAVDVLYLDRSYGDEVTPHEFAPRNQGGPTIRLLYRPGHYDVIYKNDQPIRVFLQRDSVMGHGMEMAYDSGLSNDQQAYLFVGPQSGQGLPPSNQFNYAPHHSSHVQQQPYPYQTYPCYPAPTTYHQNVPNSALPHNYPQRHDRQLTSPSVSPMPSISGPSTPSASALTSPLGYSMKPKDDKIRYVEIIQELGQHYESVPLDPETFGSAASSTAHFCNQEFQPQIWNPDENLREITTSARN